MRRILKCWLGCVAMVPVATPAWDLLITERAPGRFGGRLVVAQRGEPKTLNPLTAVDNASREVIHRMMADLLHINRESQQLEPALAQSWTVSADGRRYEIRLRRDIRFSDGHPMDADDVLFTFQAYLDERVRSPQRDLLIVGGKPLAVRKKDPHTVEFELSQPYAAGERLFDGIAILPKHRLLQAYEAGTLSQAWNLNTPPGEIAGLGPFRLKEYVAGQRLVLERNPYYWKADRNRKRLPYLDSLVFLTAGSEDAQVLRFQAGETDIISRVSAKNFAALAARAEQKSYVLRDLGPGLEYNFLFFNLNDISQRALPRIATKQGWFRQLGFRQAISAAIRREDIVRLVYQGRAAMLWSHVTPANKLWLSAEIPRPPRSLARARELLAAGGFSWTKEGKLRDRGGKLVEFSIVTSAGNPERVQIATLVQDDLRELGIQAHVVPLDFRALLDRLFHTFDYEACVQGLGSGDVDPTSEMNVWLSSGGTHLWHLGQRAPATWWEKEIDGLMQRQLVTRNYADRKRLYDRVQQLVAENLPIIPLASPHILVGAAAQLENFRPAILDHYTLWNVEEIFWRGQH